MASKWKRKASLLPFEGKNDSDQSVTPQQVGGPGERALFSNYRMSLPLLFCWLLLLAFGFIMMFSASYGTSFVLSSIDYDAPLKRTARFQRLRSSRLFLKRTLHIYNAASQSITCLLYSCLWRCFCFPFATDTKSKLFRMVFGDALLLRVVCLVLLSMERVAG